MKNILNNGDKIFMQQSFNVKKDGSGWYESMECSLLDSSNKTSEFDLGKYAIDLGLDAGAAPYCFERTIKELFGLKEFVMSVGNDSENRYKNYTNKKGETISFVSFKKSPTNEEGYAHYDFAAQLTVEDGGNAFNICGKQYKISDIIKDAKEKSRYYGEPNCIPSRHK